MYTVNEGSPAEINIIKMGQINQAIGLTFSTRDGTAVNSGPGQGRTCFVENWWKVSSIE